MIEKQSCGDPARVLVTFRISHAIWADRFAIVGNFDGQRRDALPMLQSALDPDWHITITLDSGRRYRFLYLCDEEQWNSDSSADDYSIGCDGRVYGIVDTRMDWPLLSANDMTAAMLAYPAWTKSGVLYEQEGARP